MTSESPGATSAGLGKRLAVWLITTQVLVLAIRFLAGQVAGWREDIIGRLMLIAWPLAILVAGVVLLLRATSLRNGRPSDTGDRVLAIVVALLTVIYVAETVLVSFGFILGWGLGAVSPPWWAQPALILMLIIAIASAVLAIIVAVNAFRMNTGRRTEGPEQPSR